MNTKNRSLVSSFFIRHSLVLMAMLAQAHALDVSVSPGGNLQAALDQVGLAGGGNVFPQIGTHNVSATLKIPNYTTMKGQGTSKPIINRIGTVDSDIVANKSVPFYNVKVDYMSINGGMTDYQMDTGAYSNRNGLDISDQHNDVRSNNAYIVNCYVTRCNLGINVGRTDNVTIKGTTLTNNGGLLGGNLGFIHNIYISSCDKILVDRIDSSNCRTGMGLKITDFYGDRTETSCVVTNNKLNKNFDRGTAIYDMNPLTVSGNTCNDNVKSGINIFRCTSGGTLTNNTALNNGYVTNSAYDIWLNGCANMTVGGNIYGSFR